MRPMRPVGVAGCVLALLAVTSAGTVGYVAAPDANSPQQASFSARVTGVLVDALVTQDGRPLRGLTATDFELFDNGVRQQVNAVETGNAHVNVMLAFDVSASMAGAPLAHVVSASHGLLASLAPGDRAGLTTFSHVVTPRALSNNPREVDEALNHLSASGGTAIIDGLYAAVQTIETIPGRSLVIVYTDGRDTASWLDAGQLLQAAKRANAVIYAVASGEARRWSVLRDVADSTGGRAIEILSVDELTAHLQTILQEFRSRYSLAYVPAGVSDKGYHRLEVRVNRRGVKVVARPGYVAGGRWP